jgi:hypothetical protein
MVATGECGRVGVRSASQAHVNKTAVAIPSRCPCLVGPAGELRETMDREGEEEEVRCDVRAADADVLTDHEMAGNTTRVAQVK